MRLKLHRILRDPVGGFLENPIYLIYRHLEMPPTDKDRRRRSGLQTAMPRPAMGRCFLSAFGHIGIWRCLPRQWTMPICGRVLREPDSRKQSALL
jgi:hypothetical protein